MKYLKDLTFGECKTVLENNDKLRLEIFSDYSDNIIEWVQWDYLDKFNNNEVEYQFNACGYGYFRVKNNTDFIYTLLNIQRSTELLDDNESKLIYYTMDLLKRFDELKDDLSDIDYNRLEGRIDKLITNLSQAFYNSIQNIIDSVYDENGLIDYFYEFWKNEIGNTLYVLDDGKVYEHVEYIKSYA